MHTDIKGTKPYIVVFCEGESEQVYIDFFKELFKECAVIKRMPDTGLFEYASKSFDNNPRCYKYAEVTDEIWFFFDVEQQDIPDIDNRYKVINKLRKLKNKPNIKVRLLMTTGCVEYWFLLHYIMKTPVIQTKADKERIVSELRKHEVTYKKGDGASTAIIANRFQCALVNGERTVRRLLTYGLPGMDDTDERNKWLLKSGYTFSNVYEAILFLESLTVVEK